MIGVRGEHRHWLYECEFPMNLSNALCNFVPTHASLFARYTILGADLPDETSETKRGRPRGLNASQITFLSCVTHEVVIRRRQTRAHKDVAECAIQVYEWNALSRDSICGHTGAVDVFGFVLRKTSEKKKLNKQKRVRTMRALAAVLRPYVSTAFPKLPV